ncbi:MAG: type II CRISPR-associated endonuclease Cas1 [Prolixibacteraceae bacterium]|nr:type II CRISPR-associated endonuclease Cas1 [Prolixibacteraceae bacterium]
MIKRTLYFGNPAYLSFKNSQLVIKLPEVVKNDSMPSGLKSSLIKTIPIEDIGVVVLDNQQITITQGLLAALSENNAVLINCDFKHLPFSLMLPTAVHHAYTEKLRFQLKSSVPLKKNLWQQTIVAKIKNQATMLEKLGVDAARMYYLAGIVKSGDVENCEGRAAAYYWKVIFDGESQCDLKLRRDLPGESFKRHRYGEPPNNLLNYGYAILRGVVARSLVASGLLTALGIHHRNKYNPYCLADDIMEPYRPLVDELVMQIVVERGLCSKQNPRFAVEDNLEQLTPELKRKLLQIPAMDIFIDGQKSPLMVGIQRTTASLMQCFEGESRKLVYPELI